jgi:hypothetical protein
MSELALQQLCNEIQEIDDYLNGKSIPLRRKLKFDKMSKDELEEKITELEALRDNELRNRAIQLQNATKEVNAELGRGFLKDYGLPRLGPHAISQSQKPGYGVHIPYMEYEIVEDEFKLLQEYSDLSTTLSAFSSLVWKFAYDMDPKGSPPSLPTWNEESNIQTFVEYVINDMIKLLKKKEELRVYTRVTLATKKLIPDIVLFRKHGAVGTLQYSYIVYLNTYLIYFGVVGHRNYRG